MLATIAFIAVVLVVAAAYVLLPRYNDWATRCHHFLQSLPTSEVESVLRANVNKRVRHYIYRWRHPNRRD